MTNFTYLIIELIMKQGAVIEYDKEQKLFTVSNKNLTDESGLVFCKYNAKLENAIVSYLENVSEAKQK